MSARRHSQVVNVDELTPREEKTGHFVFRTRRLGAQAGGRALGCSHYELEPGMTTFPFHFHSALEEALYVLEGTGTLRIGKEQLELRPGDYVAFPPGPDFAHALTAGTAFASGVDPTKGFACGTWIRMIVKEDQPPVGYYDDEPLAKK
jgi:uncharacterized cupin superfamily protein